MAPIPRVEALQRFATRLTNHPKASAELKKFGMELNPQLVELAGRVLPAETVSCGAIYQNPQADWTDGNATLQILKQFS